MGFENDDEMLFEDGYNVYSEQIGDVVGQLGGSRARVVSQDDDPLSSIMGVDAVVSSEVTTANGNVTDLTVIDSGFNYYTGETVTFNKGAGSSVGSAIVTEMKQGTGQGYHRTNDSLLSADKYLQDDDYYQEFSYEIRSGITLDRYSDMLKNILHVAGTKPFARFVSHSGIDVSVEISNVELTIT
jgi:hypothetical protein